LNNLWDWPTSYSKQQRWRWSGWRAKTKCLLKKHKNSRTKVEAVHQKNPIAIARLKGDEVKSGHGYRGTWGLRNGDENVVIEGWTHRSLPQRKTWQFENGICFQEGKTLYLLIKE